ncbi:myosin-2 heavy chain-like [Mya arenaria]|uniref:myosin-2 heavy chain-like n=1 Tax=Mya arenaria TaxID=6604 RepID=UPI0022E25A3B|nr:myosin-2 heavy chain-like [Mya arenaria]
MYKDDGDKPKAVRADITEARCKQHPTERAIFLCKHHETMICGSCLHSEHPSCLQEVVDMLHADISISCDQVNKMKSLFMELKDAILLLKDEAEHSKESYKKNADKCLQECVELGNKIKQRVDNENSNIRDGITKKHDENVRTYSRITKMCDEKIKWCDDEEIKIDYFVHYNKAGFLYLMNRYFERDILDARSDLNEIKRKHILRKIDFEENKLILKCLLEDLEEDCEEEEEVTGSDDDNATDDVACTKEIPKTRREITALMNQAKHDLEKSEKGRQKLEVELKQTKEDLNRTERARLNVEVEFERTTQDLYRMERARQKLELELKQTKEDLDRTEKARLNVEYELEQTKEDLDRNERARLNVEDELEQTKEDLDRTERARQKLEVEVKQTKEDLDQTERARVNVEVELERTKQDFDRTERARLNVEDELKQTKEDLNRTERARLIVSIQFKKTTQDLYQMERTRQTLEVEVNQTKVDLNRTEKARQKLEVEVKQTKKNLDRIEKARQKLEVEVKQTKQYLDQTERSRVNVLSELQRTKEDLDRTERAGQKLEVELKLSTKDLDRIKWERAIFQAQLSHIKDCFTWTQPAGTVNVSECMYEVIELVFTIPDGIQTRLHPSPGKPYNGGTFTGRLRVNDEENKVVCRMLKAAFRRGRMFTFGNNGEIVLDGVSLYDHQLIGWRSYLWGNYAKYIQTVKEELIVKGITEEDIDQTGKLGETFTVDGLSLIEAFPSS